MLKQFHAEGGLVQLASLSRLEMLDVTGHWEVLYEQQFLEPFNAMRHIAGCPPLNFARKKRVLRHCTSEFE